MRKIIFKAECYDDDNIEDYEKVQDMLDDCMGYDAPSVCPEIKVLEEEVVFDDKCDRSFECNKCESVYSLKFVGTLGKETGKYSCGSCGASFVARNNKYVYIEDNNGLSLAVKTLQLDIFKE